MKRTRLTILANNLKKGKALRTSIIDDHVCLLNYRYNQLTEKMQKIFIFTSYPIVISFILLTFIFNAFQWIFLITSMMIVSIIESLMAFRRKKLMAKRDAMSRWYETTSELRLGHLQVFKEKEILDEFLSSISPQPECHCIKCGRKLDFDMYLRQNFYHDQRNNLDELLTTWIKYHDAEINTNGRFGLYCCSCYSEIKSFT